MTSPSGLPRVRARAVTAGDLAATIPNAGFHGEPGIPVHSMHYDSRQIQPGDLFAALPGADFDGHRFIANAIRSGAVALLTEHRVEADLPQIVVPDSRAALAVLANRFYGDPSRELVTIGLTGTDGKTTTSHLVDGILRHHGWNTGLIGTVGIRIGEKREDHLPHQTTPESNLIQGYLREMVEAGVSHAILEATSHGLAMHRLDGTRFAVAGVTNITHEHLEYHGTVEAYRRAKAILLERVAEASGVVVLNADDEGAQSIKPYAKGATVLQFSRSQPDADLTASAIEVSAAGSHFDLAWHGESVPVSLPLIGEFNVENALCAAGIALALGLSLDDIVDALAVARGVPGRMLMVDEGQPFTVIVDYAHTPESLAKILTLLRTLHPQKRLIVVSGSAGERDVAKRPLQGAACARLADVSIFTSEDPRNEDAATIIQEIANGAVESGGVEGESFHQIPDRRDAIARAFSLAGPGDCVLLAGKGHETSIIQGYEHLPWNEEAIARELLRERM
jgi:UDP-N-acetylmuramoyl-L-alanyl-D-glutamate--2,6-diaminopimelate ligase